MADWVVNCVVFLAEISSVAVLFRRQRGLTLSLFFHYSSGWWGQVAQSVAVSRKIPRKNKNIKKYILN